MKRKIAILTTHRANNFGAVLQAASLSKVCNNLGVDAEILDYRLPLFEEQYYNPFCKLGRNPILGLRYAYRWFVHESRSRRLFSEFRRALPISAACKRKDLVEKQKNYDAFIVGSDQVWNPMQTALKPESFDRTFLLDFVANAKKSSYAASIGTKTIQPESLHGEYARLISPFSVVTMREHAGAAFIESITGRAVDTVLDPVLLQTAEQWRELSSSADTPNTGYVVIYNVQHYRRDSKWMIGAAYEYAMRNRLRVIDIFVPSAITRWNKDCVSTGPAQFVDLIDKAEAVFTNSFHASAFSVIFGKKLFLHHSNARGTTNTRFDSLLKFAKLKSTLYAENPETRDKIYIVECRESNYASLEEERNRCIEILKRMF